MDANYEKTILFASRFGVYHMMWSLFVSYRACAASVIPDTKSCSCRQTLGYQLRKLRQSFLWHINLGQITQLLLLLLLFFVLRIPAQPKYSSSINSKNIGAQSIFLFIHLATILRCSTTERVRHEFWLIVESSLILAQDLLCYLSWTDVHYIELSDL